VQIKNNKKSIESYSENKKKHARAHLIDYDVTNEIYLNFDINKKQL